MLSKKVLDALREQFHEEFGELSERDGYIQRVKADAFALIGSMPPMTGGWKLKSMTPSRALSPLRPCWASISASKPGPMWSGISPIPGCRNRF